jgi:uncharacterized OB-fold protein
MPCEKCWSDAYVIEQSGAEESQPQAYHRLLRERRENQCTAEEQAGPEADHCTVCGRKAVHPISRFCLACGDRDQIKVEKTSRRKAKG